MADKAQFAAAGRTVMVVDDDDNLRSVVSDALRAAGAQVLEFGEGRSALERLKAGCEVDLVLLDLMMPDMDGWSFRVEQKRDPLLAAIPVLAMSADPSPQALAIDATRFLPKPFHLDDLLGEVHDIFTSLARERATEAVLAQVGKLATLAASVTPEKVSASGQSLDGAVDCKPRRYCEGDIIVAKYRLTTVLGEGGMGEVWLARNLALDLDVAVKLIREARASDSANRLLTEARAAARLTHPSIVRVFDYGETAQGDPFIVMELLRGQCFADVLEERGRLPAIEAVKLLLPIASALREAHAKGIVHRDLKPENIVLTMSEAGAIVPKLVDFGIAKFFGAGGSDATTSGSVVGSPMYMSPEQARGEAFLDERVDIWALSVILYETVAGRRPFDADNTHAVLTQIIEVAPSPLTDLAAGDEALWKIVCRGLAKRADDRWPTMRAFGRALADWAIQRDVDTDTTRTSIKAAWLVDSDPPDPSPHPGAIADFAALREPRLDPRHATSDAPPIVEDNSRSLAVTFDPRRPRRRARAALLVFAALAALALVGRDPLLSAATRAALTLPTIRLHQRPTLEDRSPLAPSAAPDTIPSTAPGVDAPPPERFAGARPSGSATLAASSAVDREGSSACVQHFFTEESFQTPEAADFGFLCSEADPRHGAAALKAALVRSANGKAITAGMREWALLGWYEMAAFAVIRARCCAGARVALEVPSGTCAPIDAALNDIGAARRDGLSTALDKYRASIYCIARTPAASAYPYDRASPLQGGEESAFVRLLDRAGSPPGP